MRRAFFVLLFFGLVHGVLAQGWEVQPHQATINSLTSFVRAGASTLWAVGAAGTIIRSDDVGATWWAQASGTGVLLHDIAAANSDTAWAVGESGVIMNTTDGGESWHSQESGTEVALFDVVFTSAQNGWVVGGDYTIYTGSAVLLRTTNGGGTWQRETVLDTCAGLRGVFFLDDSTGWVVGGLGSRFRTTDAGATWTNQTGSWRNGALFQVQFVDSQHGWTVGEPDSHGGKVLFTTDGGESWNPQHAGIAETLTSLWFTDSLNGWVASLHGAIARTCDGGVSWTQGTLPLPNCGKILFSDTTGGWAVGSWGRVCTTTNGGGYWTILTGQELFVDLRSTHFADAHFGWAVGDSGLTRRTTNGGESWVTVNANTATNLHGVWGTGDGTAWIVGENSTILHTSDGGSAWESQPCGNVGYLWAIAMRDVEHGWTVGSLGTILHTTDGGEHWLAQASATQSFLYGVVCGAGQSAWVAGDYGVVLHTTNDGVDWQAQTLPDVFCLNGIAAAGEDSAWVVGEGLVQGFVARTTDGGQTWLRQGVPTTLFGVSFSDHLNGWAVGRNGAMIRTTDGGVIWTGWESGWDWNLYSVSSPTAQYAWTVGTVGMTLHYGGAVNAQPVHAAALPQEYALSAYPNPFNPTTTLEISLPSAGRVTVTVYDLTGRTVATLLEEGFLVAGAHTLHFDGTGLSSGVYFAQLKSAHVTQTRKLVLLK